MTFVKQIGSAAALGAAMLTGAGLCAPPAQAAYVVTLDQVGSNVVATGSGTIDLDGLSPIGPGLTIPFVVPSAGEIYTGPHSYVATSDYTGYTGPTSFGSGGLAVASSGTGDLVGISAAFDLEVPAGYTSNSSLSDTATYDNATFASLGVTPGVYVWTWEPPGAVIDDSFTLDAVATTVPEPASLALLALPLGLVLLLAARRRGAKPTPA